MHFLWDSRYIFWSRRTFKTTLHVESLTLSTIMFIRFLESIVQFTKSQLIKSLSLSLMMRRRRRYCEYTIPGKTCLNRYKLLFLMTKGIPQDIPYGAQMGYPTLCRDHFKHIRTFKQLLPGHQKSSVQTLIYPFFTI